MICLIVGDFGVGKDTVADLLLQTVLDRHDCLKAQKILSYTTRLPRYEGENTHIFCTRQTFEQFDDIVAFTKIGGALYGARASQFDENKINLYCVDGKGVEDIVKADIDDCVVVEVIRPKWLIDVPDERKNRRPYRNSYDYKVNYRIVNDGDMEKLKASVIDCYNFLLKKMKKSL